MTGQYPTGTVQEHESQFIVGKANLKQDNISNISKLDNKALF
jgi:hypothetical protein